MNKTPTHLLLALAMTLLAACSADSSSSSPTGAHARATQPLEESTATCWSPTGSASTPRTSHTATVLANGKVLVVGGAWSYLSSNGGWYEYVFHASAELYDPTTGTWSATGSMSVARRSHTATLLPNGKVLVAGGINDLDAAYASAELYDPATGTWSVTGSLSANRYLHSATLLANGKVLVAGGITRSADGATTTTVGSAEVYDPATGTWSTTGSLSVARRSPEATTLPNGKALIVGGATDGGTTFASAELYDPATGTWSATGSLSVARRSHTQTLLPNGKVLVAGGSAFGAAVNGPFASAELYDPATGTWSATGSMSVTRVAHAAALLANGKVLVAGAGGGSPASAEVYDPATGTWSAAGSMATPRTFHSALPLPNGKVLVVAGSYGVNYPLEAELYSCGVETGTTCPDGSPWSEVNVSSGDLTLKLYCPQQMTLECGASTWADPGASAADGAGAVGVHKYNTGDDDGDGVPGAQDPDDFGPGPNMSVAGSYSMEYIAWNSAATVSAVRTVDVQDTTPPVLKLKGAAQSTHLCGSEWVDPGVEASDRCDGDLTQLVGKSGYVNGWSEGTYTVTYSLTDNAQNSAPSLTRTVEVVDCPW